MMHIMHWCIIGNMPVLWSILYWLTELLRNLQTFVATPFTGIWYPFHCPCIVCMTLTWLKSLFLIGWSSQLAGCDWLVTIFIQTIYSVVLCWCSLRAVMVLGVCSNYKKVWSLFKEKFETHKFPLNPCK